MVDVIPAIIPSDYAHLAASVARVRGVVGRVQIDIIDGKYAPQPSWPFNGKDADAYARIVNQEEGLPGWQDFDFEIDLMVQHPEAVVEEWIAAGADTLIVHIESAQDIEPIYEQTVQTGTHLALALKPNTPIEVIEPWADRIQFVQCMGNDRIGYHGVALDPLVVTKIAGIRSQFPELGIGVDIGVTFETAHQLVAAGATRLASGSTIFNAVDIAEAVARLRAA
jgi:ribulose-phosphate 3-epimerase